MRIASRQRRGFSLVDTLAIAASVSLLASVALPALQDARMFSRENDCKNRLKQIGLAQHNYHDTYRSFPPGWITRRPSGEGHPSTGWQSSILPYVDQAPLFNQLELTHAVYEGQPDKQRLLKSSILAYRCPVDSVGGTNPLRGNWGTSNFVGSYGADPISRWSPSEYWPGQVETAQMPGRAVAKRKSSGIFFANSHVKIRDITDGTSNTIMVGEKCVIGRSAIWPGPRSNYNESDVVADGSYASPLNDSESGYSSRHPGGLLHFCFCDGAVRLIRQDIDSKPEWGLLQKLSHRNDGQPIGQF